MELESGEWREYSVVRVESGRGVGSCKTKTTPGINPTKDPNLKD